MKIKLSFSLILLVCFIAFSSTAQSKKARKDAKNKKITELINNKKFSFKVQTVQPMRGGTVNNLNLLSFEMILKKDTLISYLPYFGRAFTAPMNPRDSPLNFNTTDFDYVVEKGRKGSQEIKIDLKNRPDSRQFFLVIDQSGYGSLQVTSVNREPISYFGFITAIEE